ncbi:MAG TPA: histidine kinase [Gaiellaceae bacterium]
MDESHAQQTEVAIWQRRLLPAELVEAAEGGRSARDWVVDVVLVLGALGIGALALGESWPDHGAVLAVVDIVFGTAVCAALWVRRSHPVGVAAAAIVVGAFSAMAGGAVLVAIFNAAVRTSRRTLLVLLLLALGSLTVYALLYPGAGSVAQQLLIGILFLAGALGWGLFARARRELVYSLRERAERVEAEQRLRIAQAREAERRRIAREMHDVLAHRLSLLSVHAGALEFRGDAAPRDLAEAAGVIRATAKLALEELRGVIGVLRDDAEDGSVEPPQPTLTELPALVDESRAAGAHVALTLDGPIDDVPASQGRAAYRVVQEGLTNARKHAPGAAVEVTLASTPGESVVVELRNRRTAGIHAAASSGEGAGLVGLAERVSLCGGELQHGPDADGDFVLRAVLPWSA